MAVAEHPRLSGARAEAGAGVGPGGVRAAVLVALMLALMLPVYFFLADIRWSPLRVVLIFFALPVALRAFFAGEVKFRFPDLMLLFFGIWVVVTLLYHHGLARFQLSVITFIEIYGGYLVGRAAVRDKSDFLFLFRVFVFTLVLLAPFALIELFTNKNYLQEAFRGFLPTFFKGTSSYGRLGLNRVMASFEHPILFGLYCSLGIATLLYIHAARPARGLFWASFAAGMTFTSLSSAPLLSVVVQLGLMIWSRITKGQWWLLFWLFSICYVVVDLLSNRTPITILIDYITFDPRTAWTRVLIWEFGSDEIWRNPIFGIGLNDWRRPYWLTGSVDNFWLLMGMRHGLVGAAFLVAGMAGVFFAIARAKLHTTELLLIRRGYLISLLGVFMSLTTVHIWGDTSVFIMLFVGAGMWLVEVQEREAALAAQQQAEAVPAGRVADRSARSGAGARKSSGGSVPASGQGADRSRFTRQVTRHDRRSGRAPSDPDSAPDPGSGQGRSGPRPPR